MEKVALCADEMMVSHPRALGLEGENLQAQPWLNVYTCVNDARSSLREASEVSEVWVASSSQMDPVNLAAALKKDVPSRKVFVLAENPSGSCRSRASQAGVEEVMTFAALAQAYRRKKAGCALSGASSAENLVAASTANAISAVKGGPATVSAGNQPAASMGDPAMVSAGNQPMVSTGDPPAARTGCTIVREPIRATGPLPVEEEGGLKTLSFTGGKGGLVQASSGRKASTSRGFLLPVVSGSGGCGKSTLSCLMAIIAQQAGINTLLLDLDLQFGDCRDLMGYESVLTVEEALDLPQRLSQTRPHPQKPALLAPPVHVERGEKLQGKIPQLIALAQDSFDLVIVNTGSFWMDQHIALLESCDKALFLVDQRPSSLRGCKRALDLCTRCGIAASPFVFVVNRCSRNALYSSLDVSCALHGAQTIELRDGGADVEDLMAACQPEDLVHSHNALALSVEGLLGKVVPAAAEAGIGRASAEGRVGLLSSLLKR